MLAAALGEPNVRAFLDMIRVGEGTADPDGYRRHFGGRLFDSFDDHPRIAITAGLGRNKYTSTAAGAYQFLSRTWDECAKALGLRDFSPQSQDLAAVFLIDRRRALDDVLAGRIEAAIAKCAREWASLPGSPYGQPVKTLEQALKTYAERGGTTAGVDFVADGFTPSAALAATLQPQEAPMAPFIAAALPALVTAIPQLGKLFGSGSDVAERNVKAAELAVGIVQKAVGARNVQEAVEVIKADPSMAKAAADAVQTHWFELVEAGGGGIEGAAKRDAARMADSDRVRDVFKSHSLWVALFLLPLVYLVVLSIIGVLGPVQWSDDVRASIAGLIVGTIIGGLMGYYFGQTTSRNRGAGSA